MGWLSGAGNAWTQAGMAQFAKNQAAREKQNERNRMREEINNAFKAMGLEIPEGDMSPELAGDVARVKLGERDKQEKESKEAKRNQAWMGYMSKRYPDAAGVFASIGPENLDDSMKQSIHADLKELGQAGALKKWLGNRGIDTTGVDDPQILSGILNQDFDMEAKRAGWDHDKEMEDIRHKNDLGEISYRGQVDRQNAKYANDLEGNAGELGGYAGDLYDRAANILKTQGLPAFQKAVGPGGEIAKYAGAIKDKSQSGMFERAINTLEMNAVDAENQKAQERAEIPVKAKAMREKIEGPEKNTPVLDALFDPFTWAGGAGVAATKGAGRGVAGLAGKFMQRTAPGAEKAATESAGSAAADLRIPAFQRNGVNPNRPGPQEMGMVKWDPSAPHRINTVGPGESPNLLNGRGGTWESTPFTRRPVQPRELPAGNRPLQLSAPVRTNPPYSEGLTPEGGALPNYELLPDVARWRSLIEQITGARYGGNPNMGAWSMEGF